MRYVEKYLLCIVFQSFLKQKDIYAKSCMSHFSIDIYLRCILFFYAALYNGSGKSTG